MAHPFETLDLKVTTTKTYVTIYNRRFPFWALLELFEDFENTDPSGKGRALKVVAGTFRPIENQLIADGVLRKKPSGGIYRGPAFAEFIARLRATADVLMEEGRM